MGPPCEHGGRYDSFYPTNPYSASLQWGRRVNTAEGGKGFDEYDSFYPTLQWGRRVNTAEGSLLAIGFHYDSKLQWGRRVNTAEGRNRSIQHHPAVPASMGPPCEHGGRSASCSTWSMSAIVLQWGRRVNTAEGSHPWSGRHRHQSFNGAAV